MFWKKDKKESQEKEQMSQEELINEVLGKLKETKSSKEQNIQVPSKVPLMSGESLFNYNPTELDENQLKMIRNPIPAGELASSNYFEEFLKESVVEGMRIAAPKFMLQVGLLSFQEQCETMVAKMIHQMAVSVQEEKNTQLVVDICPIYDKEGNVDGMNLTINENKFSTETTKTVQ